MRRLIILAEVALGLLFASCTKEEQRTLSVIPAPLKVELQQEVFSLNSETGLYIDASEGDKKILEDYLVASSMNLRMVYLIRYMQWRKQSKLKRIRVLNWWQMI